MYPFKSFGILVQQPFGTFFVTVLPARLLLDTAYSDRLKARLRTDGSYDLDGSQRDLLENRLKSIGGFIDTSNAAFPNSIILAANYRELDGLIEEEDSRKWKFNLNEKNNTGELIIPASDKLAPIIDGQHRLFGFRYSQERDRLDFPLLCSIYLDLPKPYQASLFATINSNQKPVSKSQTYELFGYNVEEEKPEIWTPEKFSVFLARKLNAEQESPLYKHIEIAAENDIVLSRTASRNAGSWMVSMATIVEGILKLISSNPKLDSYDMDGRVRYEHKPRTVLRDVRTNDRTPIRKLYIDGNDQLIFMGLMNFFAAVQQTLWREAVNGSYIVKTVGLQALMEIARSIFRTAVTERTFSTEFFIKYFRHATGIDFSDVFFEASGGGRTRIRNVLELALGLRDTKEILESQYLKDDAEHYRRLLTQAKFPIGSISSSDH